MEELIQIEEKQIETERLIVVRDIFVFACYTGLSFADISKLSDIHLQQKSEGKLWIIIDRSKTNNRCRIPILPKAKEILNRYKDYPKTNGKNL